MAGEAIEKIKQKEKDAADIIKEAKDEAYKIVLRSGEKKSDFVKEKDKLLDKEEKKIKEKYEDQTQEILDQIGDEEQKEVENINKHCNVNLKKVTKFIFSEIVKE
jgi:vacuolar-type H+-ATPase subunit H